MSVDGKAAFISTYLCDVFDLFQESAGICGILFFDFYDLQTNCQNI